MLTTRERIITILVCVCPQEIGDPNTWARGLEYAISIRYKNASYLKRVRFLVSCFRKNGSNFYMRSPEELAVLNL